MINVWTLETANIMNVQVHDQVCPQLKIKNEFSNKPALQLKYATQLTRASNPNYLSVNLEMDEQILVSAFSSM